MIKAGEGMRSRVNLKKIYYAKVEAKKETTMTTTSKPSETFRNGAQNILYDKRMRAKRSKRQEANLTAAIQFVKHWY